MKTLYYNGDILTMENTSYEAIYVENGLIKKCGNYKDLKQYISSDVKLVDLNNKCRH